MNCLVGSLRDLLYAGNDWVCYIPHMIVGGILICSVIGIVKNSVSSRLDKQDR